MKHIGIVACSAEGAALCYRTICQEAIAKYGNYIHPEISMHTPPLSEYMKCIDANDWQGVGDIMLASVNKLQAAGADFVICPDNTIHTAFNLMINKSSLPWLHIVEEVAKVAQQKQYQTLAILGTKYTMDGSVYPEKLEKMGISYQVPTLEEKLEIDRIIFEELVHGQILGSSRRYYEDVIDRMKLNGCDAVVLGCTEIPLLIESQHSSLPILDSTRILAYSALNYASD